MNQQAAELGTIDQQFAESGGTVRIPGEHGQLIILDTVLVIRRLPDREELALGLDITVEDQWRSVCYRNRVITPVDLKNLHQFLKAAMTDLHPEITAPAFQSESAGLVLSVTASSELTIQLDVAVAEYLDDPEPEIGGILIEMTRAALGEPIDVAEAMVDVFAGPNTLQEEG